MQPSEPLPDDIKTFADWIYQQFRATDPIEVKNILGVPYKFKYCVGETIETPDPLVRRVAERQYEEITLQAGETRVLMGAAAYIYVDGVARTYLYKKVLNDLQVPKSEGGVAGLEYNKAEEQAANATADVGQLVEAAKLVIIGKVGYANHAVPQHSAVGGTPIATGQAPAGHNPNAMADNQGNIPAQQPVSPTQPTTAPELPPADDDGDAFANMDSGDQGDDKPTINTELPTEFTIGDDFYDVTANGRARKNKVFTSVPEFNTAQAQYVASQNG